MRERERERERKKEFDVRSAHPARGTRDAIVFESERERLERCTIEFNFEIDFALYALNSSSRFSGFAN